MALAETAELVARLSLKDEFSSKVRGIQGKLQNLDKIGADVQRGLANTATNLTKIGIVAGAAVTSQIFIGIRSLEHLERVQNQTNAVIESTGGVAGVSAKEVRALSEEIENLTTVDDKAVQEAQNLLLTFTGIGKDVFPDATKAVINMGLALADGDVAAADFGTATIQVGKALQDPIKGVTALRKAGVILDEQQQEQIKTFVESGDVLSAQKIILGELEKEFGKSGDAAARGFGGDMRRFQDAVEESQQALAIGFLPVLSKVADVLKDKLSDPRTLAQIKEFGTGLAKGLDKLIDAAGRIPWGQIGDAMRLVGTGAKAALDLFTGLPPWVQTAVLTGWGLNKLTGGALGSIVGELGKGLIKGVLGMTAGVVNITAGVVKGGGIPGIIPGGGKGGDLFSKVLKVTLIGIAAATLIELAGALADQSAQNEKEKEKLDTKTSAFASAPTTSQDDIRNSIKGIKEVKEELLFGAKAWTAEGIAFQLNIDGVRDSVNAQIAALEAALTREPTIPPSSAKTGVQGPDERAASVIAAAPVWQQIRDNAAKTTSVLSADLADTKGAITLLRKDPGVNSTALQSFRATERAGKLTSAITTYQLSAQRSGDNRIVAALYATRPQTTVNVNVTAASVQKASVTQARSGTATGSRYGIS